MKPARPPSAQEEHDAMREMMRPKLISVEGMDALLSGAAARSVQDSLSNAMARHPGLTRAEAEEMARAFGF
jgi:arginine deiminase